MAYTRGCSRGADLPRPTRTEGEVPCGQIVNGSCLGGVVGEVEFSLFSGVAILLIHQGCDVAEPGLLGKLPMITGGFPVHRIHAAGHHVPDRFGNGEIVKKPLPFEGEVVPEMNVVDHDAARFQDAVDGAVGCIEISNVIEHQVGADHVDAGRSNKTVQVFRSTMIHELDTGAEAKIGGRERLERSLGKGGGAEKGE